MKMRQYLIILIVLSLQVLSSCEMGEDEMDDYINTIRKIHMYNIDSSRLFFRLDYEGPSLYSEEYIRQYGNFFIFQNGLRSEQAGIIAFLLDNAKPAKIDPKKTLCKQKEWKDSTGLKMAAA